MALIPQVPVLFTGNIRVNLSPLGLHNDAELWNALRRWTWGSLLMWEEYIHCFTIPFVGILTSGDSNLRW